nr:gliding motility-associated C-terminal domain-containing protein [Saprospiraceae bacterium]
MWNSLFKYTGFLLLCFFISPEIKGSHIIGGEINYRCLGNNQYEVTFTLIRDCFYGQVPYDDPASIALFDSNNNLDTIVGDTNRIYMKLREVTRIIPEIDDDCIELPGDLCVETTTYRDTVELPFREGGYLLVYQRCCRNRALVNMKSPAGTGVTYTTRISETSLIECNSAATFKNWPPILICINQPINFDHSAVGTEGDSLVYRLCDPLGGVSPFNPLPNPPESPPYPPIEWNTPEFSLHNKLGGTDSLKIDPHTGIITGTPTIIGSFIVGVCLEEYKEGELISTTNRDFQYNVGECRKCEADFFVPENYCNELEITFENLSPGCFYHKWFFGGLADPLGTSTEVNPSFTFPDFGTYEVTLVSSDDSPECNDTITRFVNLLDESFEVDIKVERGKCLDTLPLSLIAVIESDNLSEFNYLWEVEVGDKKHFSTDSIFNINVFGVESIRIDLRVINTELDCWKTVNLEYETGLILDDGLYLTDFICNGDTTNIFQNGNASHHYQWSPEVEIIGPADVPSPLISPDQETLYTAQMTNQNCSGEISILVGVYNPENLQIIPDTICGTRTVTFDVNPFIGFASDIWWRFLKDGVQIGFSRMHFPTFTFPEYGDFEVILNPRDFDFDGCFDTVRQNIHLFDWDIELNLDIERKSCKDSLQLCLRAFVSSGEIVESHYFQWVINGDTLDNSSPELEHFVSGVDSIIHISTSVHNYSGCSQTRDTVIASGLLTDIPVRDTTAICTGDTLQLNVPFSEEYSYLWEPDKYFITPNDIHNPKAVPESDITYSLMVEGADCEATFFLKVELFNTEFTLPELIFCDKLFVHLRVDTLDDTDYYWIVFQETDTVYTGSDISPRIEFDDYGEYDVELVLFDIESGCNQKFYTQITLVNWDLWDIGIEVHRTECMMNELTLDLSAFVTGDSPPDNLDFEWLISGDTTIHTTGDSIALELQNIGHLKVQLIATDSIGCSHTHTIELNYDIFEVTERDTIFICVGDTVFLNPDFHPDFDYIWSPATGLLDVVTHSNPSASPSATTLYTANIIIGNCTGEKEVLVIVNENPAIVSLTADPITVLPGEESLLFAEVQPQGTAILWRPAISLDNPNIHNPLATPLETTTYVITITTEEGCTSVDSVTVFVQNLPCESPYIFLPNAFSPNGDGMNDILYLLGDHIDQFVLVIYNRWGQEVFRTVELDRGWNGKFRGEDLSSGVYGYYLEVECIGGAHFSEKGNVSLIR